MSSSETEILIDSQPAAAGCDWLCLPMTASRLVRLGQVLFDNPSIFLQQHLICQPTQFLPSTLILQSIQPLRSSQILQTIWNLQPNLIRPPILSLFCANKCNRSFFSDILFKIISFHLHYILQQTQEKFISKSEKEHE